MSSEPAREPARAPGSGAMFDLLARRYDLLNRLMSLGLDALWRRRLVRALALPAAPEVLDVATGTADVALLLGRTRGDARVVGVDPSAAMRAVGERTLARAGLAPRVRLEDGDAQALAYPAACFDGVSVAFGIRNVPDRLRALREMARVCRPGRRVAVLELTEPRGRGPLAALARLHVHVVVPWLGALFSGAREYRYLQASIAAFPPAPAFAALMAEAGLTDVVATPLCCGAVHLFVGTVPG